MALRVLMTLSSHVRLKHVLEKLSPSFLKLRVRLIASTESRIHESLVDFFPKKSKPTCTEFLSDHTFNVIKHGHSLVKQMLKYQSRFEQSVISAVF